MKKDEKIKKLEKELKAYRELGSVEELKKLKQKYVALPPVLGKLDKFGEVRLHCPACNAIVMDSTNHHGLPSCGMCSQMLDWKGVDWRKKEILEMEERSRLEREGQR